MARTIQSRVVTTRVDRDTGELIESIEKQERVVGGKQATQYSMWMGQLSAIKGLTSNQMLLLFALSLEIEFETGEIDISTARRKKLATDLDISEGTLRNIISQLTKLDFIRKLDSGVYQMSPFLFYRGKLKQLDAQRELYLKKAA
ncbi:hypothetical protein CTT31_02180 [Pseudoalteromonas maricaloris]|uniref:replication/maintenance protein RepL n=1 Tax=Pseudoalteromonas maricaloris TaxID=184924 RepID=UPI0021AD5549|nr:replication/maintenance protein RepL [Pseudoalteromonas flavipulchra]USE67990.1 hypothetical protein CTT31_02180 [Pseudoalteromonas flavipulchra]